LAPLFHRPTVWATHGVDPKTGRLPGETVVDALKRLNLYDEGAFFMCNSGDTCVPLG
jgi:hypothetical protein